MSKLEQVITTFDQHNMSSYVAGPIYSSWLFRINSTLINLVSRQVKFPDGSGVEHTPWEEEVTDDVKAEIMNWLGVRNVVCDAIDNLEGGYPPAEIYNTYEWLLGNNPEDNALAIKQQFAKEYVDRKNKGDKLHSPIKQYVEDNYTTVVRGYQALVDTKEQVISYLDDAMFAKNKASPLDYGNLPEWFDDMVENVTASKFSTMYIKKLYMLDRNLAPTTRKSIETELFLMKECAQKLGIELHEPSEHDDLDDGYLASIGLKAA
jgi:hypothetical protein